MRIVTASILAAFATLAAAAPALAEPKCTTEPKSAWLTEDAMKAKIAGMGYKDIRTFKSTSGGCYEIYGHDKNGKKAEVYFNPVTGDIVHAK
ncbi:PepSY domain-containing protein [Azospirillum sp. RWY-5-1]|uniref:PepSY domain-containing protein n=1 Tax=Azospirillum oleiclasticum TaxID=2735135 RepID=A0ABX2T784_9PROT|nr:PepSY domain-containing protein [Azospirillum oleiclasticum]NYZ11972.1 PepSY domain-containing protein [Azospirillum oleiclasticum]NYZ19132.1 PepSY domain-containing protein [Azospirillum oleiclasticum]